MASNESNHSESFWFPEALKEPTPAAQAEQAMSQFLRRKACRSPLSEGAIAPGAPRVYWHAGSEADFFERVPKLPNSSLIVARSSVFGHEIPQLTGQALAQWTLIGEDIPRDGTCFRAFDLGAAKWIGAGRIYHDQGEVSAFLVEGLFSDFCKFADDSSRLVLVVFDVDRTNESSES
jgi:hypothetical protein